MMRKIKVLLGYLVFKTGLYKFFLRNKAIVLLFHRVDDALAHKRLTCSTKMFDSICQLAKNHFNVISLTELVNKLNAGKDISNDMVISFDDGYLDNYQYAAPILREHGLDACFFIATDFIGSEHTTWWDKEDDVKSTWMNWDQVREMRRWGFEIAAHTKNHVDLGKVDRDVAYQEIKGSKDRLEQELGEPINLFCYPYGRKEQITEENRQIVRDLGFICCPSAYGGLVENNSDPFYMLRTPVDSYYETAWDFAFDLIRT